jgi:hypothetical protein
MVDGLVTLAGSLTATSGVLFEQRDPAGIAGHLVVTEPWRFELAGAAPLVGAPLGACSTSGRSCVSGLDCPRRESCAGRRPAEPGNDAVDLTGRGTGRDELQRCQSAVSRLADFAADVLPVAPMATKVEISGGHNTVVVPVGSGLTVLHYKSMWVGAGGAFTIDGPTDAIVVVAIDAGLRILNGAEVRLAGGLQAQNVLWVFAGHRPNSVSLGVGSVFNGTILALERRIHLHRNVVLHGAVYAHSVALQPYARVEHVPFTPQLPAVVRVDSQTARGNGLLAYVTTITNTTPYTSPATTIQIPLAASDHFVAVSPSQGTCLHDGSSDGGVVTCFLGVIQGIHAGQAKSATVRVEVE